ncbi:MAG: tyrosine-protein phosphatase [Planctomycetia bacterium]|nr:tyrosine-protein phosphatase [Planctomycetia bacterium]
MKNHPILSFNTFVSFWCLILLSSGSLLAAEIELLTPPDGSTFDPVSPVEREFLANSDARSVRPPKPESAVAEHLAKVAEYEAAVAQYQAEGKNIKELKKPKDRYNFYENNAWSAALMERYKIESQTYRPFSWKTDAPLSDAVVLFSETPDFKTSLRCYPSLDKRKRLECAIRPANLKLGVKYYWKVSGRDAEGEPICSDVWTFTTLDIPPRRLSSPAVSNFRDLGGGTNADGKRVRQGLLFRSGATTPPKYCLVKKGTPEEEYLYFFREVVNLKTELDLRSEDEFQRRCREWGEIGLDCVGVSRECYPLLGYHLYHPTNRPLYRAIFARLAEPDAYPLVFHCAAGADRTGTLGVLLDGIIGRDDQTILDNYEMTSLSGHSRYRYSRKAAGMFETLEGVAPGEPMRVQVVRFLLDVGVPQSDIDAIREILVEE